MASFEIVDFINEVRKSDEKPVQLRHADFMVKTSKVLGLETSEKFRSSYLAGNGETRPCYRFPKREACLMAMSYSYELQAQIFDRMTAMEDALKAQKPELSRMDLIQLALQAEQENQELRGQVAILAPKAKGLDRIADCTNVLGIRESAKVLKIGQNQLTQYLIDHKVVYRDNFSKIQAYQKSIDNKLVHVAVSAPRLFESGEKVFTQVKLTQKLITRIAKRLEQEVAA